MVAEWRSETGEGSPSLILHEVRRSLMPTAIVFNMVNMTIFLSKAEVFSVFWVKKHSQYNSGHHKTIKLSNEIQIKSVI